MKPEVHPEYHSIKVTCICDSVMEIGLRLAATSWLTFAQAAPFLCGQAKDH